MLDFLSQVDADIFIFFNHSIRCEFMDKMMMLFTGRFIWVPMYAAILMIFARSQRWKVLVAMIAALVLAITLTDQTCATLIRPYVERLRPSNLENPLSAMTMIVDDYRGGSYGFPSCHAANSFALAVFMILAVRKRAFTAFILGWAIINSYSRLYLGVHYPGDLFVGALIGSAIGALCFYAAARLLRTERDNYRASLSQPLLMLPVGVQISPALHIRAIPLTADRLMMAIGLLTAAIIVILSI